MRKEMPYDFEVVPINQGLLVVNTTTWADKGFLVKVKGPTGSQQVELNGASKMVRLSGLENGQDYNVSIRRSDFVGRLKYRRVDFLARPNNISNYIVLLGASVGKTWNLRELMTRLSLDDHFWGYRGYYEFDKGPLVNELLSALVKPDTVIIKECAAYFPRDTTKSMEKIVQWVEELRRAKITPVLATVVPITAERAGEKPEQLESLNAFNEALRKFGTEQDVQVLDLQAALAQNEESGVLAERFADDDGLHLQERAYSEILDPLMARKFVQGGQRKSSQ